MNNIDDPRLVFYLENQQLIDEWASVAKDLQQAAIEFYYSLGDDLEEIAPSLGDDVLVARTESGYPRVGLAHRSWYAGDEHRVSICLEFNLKNTSFVSGHRLLGVRREEVDSRANEMSEAIRSRIEPDHPARGVWRSNTTWPAFKAVDGCSADRYWEDLAPFREALITDILEAWEAFNIGVSDAVREVPDPS